MRVRLCEPADLPILMELGRAFHEELAWHHLPLDEQKAEAGAAHAIGQHLAIGVEDDSGELCGALLLHPMESGFWFSSAPFLQEIGFYVRPDKRASRAAVMLLDAAKAIADDIGLPLFSTPFSGVAVDRKDKLFERSGFVRLGSIYRWS